MNRPGRTRSDDFGYADSGFNRVKFDDLAANDVHTYRDILAPVSFGGLSGTWQPDGRLTDPVQSLDTDRRQAGLSVFNGMNPNGDWTLFIADLSPGGAAILNNWSLDIAAVPEAPLSGLLTSLGLALLFACRRSQQCNR